MWYFLWLPAGQHGGHLMPYAGPPQARTQTHSHTHTHTLSFAWVVLTFINKFPCCLCHGHGHRRRARKSLHSALYTLWPEATVPGGGGGRRVRNQNYVKTKWAMFFENFEMFGRANRWNFANIFWSIYQFLLRSQFLLFLSFLAFFLTGPRIQKELIEKSNYFRFQEHLWLLLRVRMMLLLLPEHFMVWLVILRVVEHKDNALQHGSLRGGGENDGQRQDGCQQ